MSFCNNSLSNKEVAGQNINVTVFRLSFANLIWSKGLLAFGSSLFILRGIYAWSSFFDSCEDGFYGLFVNGFH